jgi:hypothetical protein
MFQITLVCVAYCRNINKMYILREEEQQEARENV